MDNPYAMSFCPVDLVNNPPLYTAWYHSSTAFSSFQEWAIAMARHPSSVCLSVRPSFSFCANRFFSHTNGQIATKLSQDGLQVSVHPGCAQGQGQGQRSHDTGTFVLARKSLLLPGKWPDRDQTCTRWSPGTPASRVCLRSRSQVTWYAHFLGFLEWATPSLTVWFVLPSIPFALHVPFLQILYWA